MKKKFYKRSIFNSLVIFYIVIFAFLSSSSATAQENCVITRDHGQGYTTTINSVTDNGNNNYTIVLNVKHNGCVDTCKAMARYSVEALPGTYSNVFVTVISGNLNYQNIDLGPNLGGDPFSGFRLTGTAGFGNGSPGEFNITYTLSGGLQNQLTQVKAGGDLLQVSFTVTDFQSVLDCENQNIFPYYTPPEGGKLEKVTLKNLHSIAKMVNDLGNKTQVSG